MILDNVRMSNGLLPDGPKRLPDKCRQVTSMSLKPLQCLGLKRELINGQL